MPVRKTQGGKCRKYGTVGTEYCGKDKAKAYTQESAIKRSQARRGKRSK